MGKARIDGILEGEVLLKNLSVTGCCLECTALADTIEPNKTYKIIIQPESAADIEEFVIQAECRWIRHGDYCSDIGLQITESPKGKHFQRYVDYLVYHSTLV
jgi:hypothetical protein